jgi:predicted secreted protein
MKKITKKEIRKFIEDAMRKVRLRFRTSLTGKKAEKLLDNFSRKYAAEIKKSIKRNVPQTSNAQRPTMVRKQTKKIR